MVTNNPVNTWDYLGLTVGDFITREMRFRVQQMFNANPNSGSVPHAWNELAYTDNEGEMFSALRNNIDGWYRTYLSAIQNQLTYSWKTFRIHRQIANRQENWRFPNTGLFSTGFWLNGSKGVHVQGEFEAIICGTRFQDIRWRKRSIRWEWRDQIDAQGYSEIRQGDSGNDAFWKQLLEGSWDAFLEGKGSLPDVSFWLTVYWPDRRQEERTAP